MQIFTMLSSFFQDAAIFISFIAFIGLLIQKKPISDIIKGTLKAMLGIIILLEGVGIVSNALSPLSVAIASLFSNATLSTNLNDYASFIGLYGFEIGVVMVLGFVSNIIIARFTRFKTIYLTGHLMFFYSMLWLAVGVEANLSGALLLGFGVFCYLISTIVFPYLLVKDIKHLTGSTNFTIGHSASMFCWLGARFGSLFKSNNRNAEDLKLPKSLDFLKDTALASGIVMVITYLIVFFIISPENQALIYTGNTVTFILKSGMSFAAGMVVLLLGVRMMMTEITPSFKGVSQRLVPGAIPALDIPLVFQYGPNSLMIGFIVSLVFSLIAMMAINVSGISAYSILPATIACYFDAAPSAIFANKRGGMKAAVIWSAICGVVMMLLVSVALPYLADTAGTFVQQFGANEESVFIVIFSSIAEFLSSILS